MSDKRQTPRARLHVFASLRVGRQILPCMLLDVSEGGLSLMLMREEELHPNHQVQVSFKTGEEHGKSIDVDAVLVARRGIAGMPTLWHLRTRRIDLGQRLALRDYVQTQQLRARPLTSAAA